MRFMKPKPSRLLRIVINIPQTAKTARDRIAGIHRYASAHPEWDIFTMGEHYDNLILENFSGLKVDGLITTPEIMANKKFINALRPRAIVISNGHDLTAPSCCKRFGAVTCDNYGIGREGARFLIQKHYRNYAFVGMPHIQNWSALRQQGFVDELVRNGYSYQLFKTRARSNWKQEREDLTNFLNGLPKPCAVMAPIDSRAKHVIDCCRLSNITIPDQISVLGVDNDEIICDWTNPSLSSIQLEFEQSGYRLARLLDELMTTEGSTKPRIETYGVTGIVERQSTSNSDGSVRIVTAARDYIRLHATADISVGDIATACGCSVRALQAKFKKVLGVRPIDELVKRRLKLATDILSKTETPIKQIGYLCGFKTLSNLKIAFKQHFGCSMSYWRTQYQTGAAAEFKQHQAPECTGEAGKLNLQGRWKHMHN